MLYEPVPRVRLERGVPQSQPDVGGGDRLVSGPRIVGKAVGLHPVISLAALIAGAELFGILGALFASLVAGILQALIVSIWKEWRATHPEQFEENKDTAGGKIEENAADRPQETGKPVNP